jgi:hypothetical protein
MRCKCGVNAVRHALACKTEVVGRMTAVKKRSNGGQTRTLCTRLRGGGWPPVEPEVPPHHLPVHRVSTKVVKWWSNFGQMVVKLWSNGGQMVVKQWSISGRPSSRRFRRTICARIPAASVYRARILVYG